MLIDLLSMDNYVHFNIKLAETIGLHAAIYVSELLNINEKAVRKDKVKDDCFVVDRNYISKRTTLSRDEQLEIDEILLKLGVLAKAEEGSDSMVLNVSVLTALFSAEKADVNKLLKATAPRAKKRTKGEVIIESLKSHVQCTNEELCKAYYEWIDAVYSKQGWMSVKSVTVAQRTIDEYSKRNLDVALKLLEIATTGGYREIQWAINSYEKDYKLTYHVIPPAEAPKSQVKATASQLSSEVF